MKQPVKLNNILGKKRYTIFYIYTNKIYYFYALSEIFQDIIRKNNKMYIIAKSLITNIQTVYVSKTYILVYIYIYIIYIYIYIYIHTHTIFVLLSIHVLIREHPYFFQGSMKTKV